MFKTIHDCRVDLVEYSVLAKPDSLHSEVDFLPASAARASFGNEDKTGDDPAKDIKLMKYLADHKHLTPFEYQHATFLIEVPLFIRSQIMRHRVPFSYNEISRRYTSEDIEFWIPDKLRGQAKSNKQASEGELPEEVQEVMISDWQKDCEFYVHRYHELLAAGVAREIARAALPQSLITRFYMGSNLRGWANFIELRRDEHAQYEVRVVANRVAEKLRELWPESCKALGV